ncbi:hypothetical protein JXK06_02055 [Patescibacteria group bacterium]|nr:hypothetical protein [Patescibacteria group bacterium]
MKKLLKNLAAFAIIAAFLVPVFAMPALAQTEDVFGTDPISVGLDNSLGDEQDPREVIGRFIKLALGFLGLIAVGIILVGGFKWMTSGGSEEKTGEAKKLLGAGVIGLIIVLASWGLATWLINNISSTIVSG